MKIIRFLHNQGIHLGLLEGENIHRVLGDLLGQYELERNFASRSEVKLTYPCVPQKIIGVAINFRGATGLQDQMREPLVFLKTPNCLIGPHDPVISRFEDVNVWGESELAIVMKVRASNISVEDAAEAILGYTIANDVSADNIQGWDHHLARSKAADTFCPLGPYIDTDFRPAGQIIEGYHNGKLLRKGTTDLRIWQDAELVSLISRWITLEPWDVIVTGAPTRVREREFLKHGDTFLCRIEGLGELENAFRVGQ